MPPTDLQTAATVPEAPAPPAPNPVDAGASAATSIRAPEGFLHSLATSLGLDPDNLKIAAKAILKNPKQSAEEIGSEAVSEVKDALTHPGASAKETGTGVVSAITNPDAQAIAKGRLKSPGLKNKVIGAEEYLTSGIPLVGGGLVKAEEQGAQGNLPGSVGTTLGTVAPLAAGGEAADEDVLSRASKAKYTIDPAESLRSQAESRADTHGLPESDETRVARAKNITPPDHITFDSIGGQEVKAPTKTIDVHPLSVTDENAPANENPAEPPEPKYEQTLAARGPHGQLPNQKVNLSPAYGDTGHYVGGGLIPYRLGEREEGLSKTLHVSADKVQDVIRQVREARNAQPSTETAGQGNIEATGGIANRELPETQPGGAGAGTEGNVRIGNEKTVPPENSVKTVKSKRPKRSK